MIYQHDRIAVGDQIVHHARKAFQIGGMQADGGLVQDVEHSGGAVADCACQLHPLALSGGKRRRSTVQRKIRKAKVHQTAGGILERLADALRHGPHGLRERRRHAFHPLDKLRERHLAGIRQIDPPQQRRPGGLGKTRAAALGADILLQELLHALHPRLVLDLGESVLDAVYGAVVGEVHLREAVRFLVLVDDMAFFGRAVIHDFLFLGGEVLERDIGPYTHLAGDILHQRPHQRAPGRNGSLVDGQAFVRDKGGLIHRTHYARAAAASAGAFAVECELLRAGGIHSLPADRAEDGLLGRHIQRRLQIMPVGTAVAGKAGEHQSEAVEKLRHRAKGAADARNARTLMQGERSGNIADVIGHCARRLRHPPPGVGRKGLQIAPGSLGI